MFRVIERDDRRRVVESSLASARDLTEWRCEWRIRRADGSVRWIQGSSTPQRQADGITVWHGCLQDVTDRRELDHARPAAAAAAASNRAKTEFLSRMSHELRTPLNAVLGFAQLMEIDHNEPPGDGQRRHLALIREAGGHLLQMIGALLDRTRIETDGNGSAQHVDRRRARRQPMRPDAGAAARLGGRSRTYDRAPCPASRPPPNRPCACRSSTA